MSETKKKKMMIMRVVAVVGNGRTVLFYSGRRDFREAQIFLAILITVIYIKGDLTFAFEKGLHYYSGGKKWGADVKTKSTFFLHFFFEQQCNF